MSNPLLNVYVKGSDGVTYKALFRLENDLYLVCNTNVDVSDFPIPVSVIRGTEVTDFDA